MVHKKQVFIVITIFSLIMFLLFIKLFVRVVRYADEAGAGKFVLTYIPAFNKALWQKNNQVYEDKIIYGEKKKNDSKIFTKKYFNLIQFSDGSFLLTLYIIFFIKYFWIIEIILFVIIIILSIMLIKKQN